MQKFRDFREWEMFTRVQIVFVLLALDGYYSELLSAEKYGKFISEIQDWCKTAEVTFSTTKLESLDLHPFFAESIRYLSKRQIPSDIVTFAKLDERIRLYHRSFGRPLIVVIITTRREIFHFKESTKDIAMSSPIWMVIFANIGTNRRICKFCQNPEVNSFRLNNNTEFFVSCCDNTKLKEWWSRDGESVEVLPVGEIINEKLQWAQNESLFHRRRQIGQLQLRAAFISKFYLLREFNGTYSGFAGEVLTTLMQLMNFSIALSISVDSVGILDELKSKWTGALGLLQRGDVDLIGNLIIVTKERLDYADATVPMLTLRSQLFIKDPDFASEVQWMSYFQTFHVGVWIIIVTIIFLTTALLMLIKFNPRRNRLWSVISESCHQLFGIFCQQGLPEFPDQLSLRITYFSISLTSLVVLASYSANLISVLTVPSSTLPFSNFEEFSNQVDYKLITLRDTLFFSEIANSKDVMEMKMFKLMKPRETLPSSISEVIQQICNGKVAYFGFPPLYDDIELPCKIVAIGNHMTVNFVFMLQRHSRYTKIMNNHIIGLHNNGILKHLKEKYHSLEYISSEKEYGVVEFWSIVPILLIICGGIVLSLLILFFEIIYHHYTEKHNTKSIWTVHFKHLKLKSLKKTAILDYCP